MARKSREISAEVRNLVVSQHREGKNQRELAGIFSIARSTIKSILKKFQKFGDVENIPGRGMKREGHDGPVSLHLGICLKHKTPKKD